MKQNEDHTYFVILQTNSNLTTTTTSRLQLLYVYNPPKFIQKFENIFLAAISSNTLQAGSNLEPILIFSLDQVQPWPPLLLWNLTTPLSTSPSHLHHWTLVTMTRTSPCPCSPCITMPPPLSGHLSPAPPCPLASSHSPESARHEPRRIRAPH